MTQQLPCSCIRELVTRMNRESSSKDSKHVHLKLQVHFLKSNPVENLSMRLLFFGLVLLCVSSVSPNSIEVNVAEVSLVDGSVEEERTCIKCVSDRSGEDEETDPSESGSVSPDAASPVFERRQKWKKKWLHKREKNRFRDHRHHHQRHHTRHERWSKTAKRLEERKHRLANDKKRSGTQVQYLERSSSTDEQKDAIDKMLALFSQTLKNETFHLKLDKPHAEIKIAPWTFVQFDSAVSSEKTIMGEPINANRLEALEAEIDTDIQDNEEDANIEDASKLSTQTEHESQSSMEIKSMTKLTDDDDDDDDDEEEDVLSETAVNSTCPENSKPFQLVSNPSPVALPDGATEYYVKLLSQQEIYCRNASQMKTSTELQEDGQERRMSRKQRRAHRRRRSGKTYSRVVGVELLERSGDVMIGAKENSTARVIDIQMQFGPLTFVMDRKAAYPFTNSRVVFPALMARLRLKIWDGQLGAARFKPKKIQPSEAVAILQLKEGDEFPDSQDLVARVVGQLSQMTTNAWNTGYLLRRIKRQFKYIYVGKMGLKKADNTNEDARNVIQLLLESLSVDKQSTTEHFVTDAPALDLENVEAVTVLSTSRPNYQ